MNVIIRWLGAFWFALLTHLDRVCQEKKNKISCIGYDITPWLLDHCTTHKKHPTLFTDVTYTLSDAISFSEPTPEQLQHADILILAVPGNILLPIFAKIAPRLSPSTILINIAKALTPDGMFFSQKIAHDFPNFAERYCMLSGGMIAKDLAMGTPLGCVCGTKNNTNFQKIHDTFSSSSLYIANSTDVVGVECAGAYKNVGSLYMGRLQGKGYAFGTITYAMTQFTADIQQFASENFWCNSATFGATSQCWGNDFVMSCLGDTRNRAYGERLGKGEKYTDLVQEIAEKKLTIEWFHMLAHLKQQEKNLTNLPFLHACLGLLTDTCSLPERR